ncbi:hypothetical protein N780_12000 [Pontibacillus chungwhensis BH030062]|uniref:CMP/dCMP-type deaminase domain-containing protein n=1 Tax=Pontibacillus chungwhensis BH030062 TaxID=1385513 RepID=A0A0A2UYD8_9BACI|nr:nucleoside deaminase [Pontibacillus chungwhensis]KGP93287.1 hypothetical protein N780_12000 [Pontibacillus chungwhensis BH030062]
MNWNQLSSQWKRCFELAWESYQLGSKPIAALVTNEEGKIVAEGKCAVHCNLPDERIRCNEIAHAEVNALLNIDNRVHTYRAPYTLYSTLEPCPLCMGALYMSGIKNLKYAAKDEYGGSIDLLGSTTYMSRKKINAEGPFVSIEEVSIVLNVAFDIEYDPTKRFVIEEMKKVYPEALEVGREFAVHRTLQQNKHLPIEKIYTLIQKALIKHLKSLHS